MAMATNDYMYACIVCAETADKYIYLAMHSMNR